MSVRYCKQRSGVDCTPIAYLNAMKFQRRPEATRELLPQIKKWLRFYRGTHLCDEEVAYKREGWTKIVRPTWIAIARRLFEGNGIILSIRYVCAVEHTQSEELTATIVTKVASGHTFFIDGVCVVDNVVRYHAINFVRYRKEPKRNSSWLTADQMIERYSEHERAHIDNVFVVHRRSR